VAGGNRKNADSILIAQLAAGATRTAAAKTAGVSETTLYRCLADPTFTQALADAKSDMIVTTVSLLTASATAAATTLHRLLSAESETVQLGACRAILELSTKWRESEEFAARLDAIEARQAQADAYQGGIRRVA